MKAGKASCDMKWRHGRITKLVSDKVVEVDGMNRQVADVRLAKQRQCMAIDVNCGDEQVVTAVGGQSDD